MKKFKFFAAALFLFTVFACGGLQKQVSLNETTKTHTIEIKASDFKFEPNNIRVSQGDRVTFRLENTSDTLHDFTLKDPGGKIIQDTDLPPRGTINVPVVFKTAGVYTFYCDRPLHASLGMRGRVEVIKQ